MTLQYEIDQFWARFHNHVHVMKSDPYDADFIGFIDDTMLRWELDWELGPGKVKKFSFTISPRGNFERIENVNQVITQAPTLDDWEYYGFKQPKENWNLARLYDRGIEVNAVTWTHQLLQYPEGDFELLLKADNIGQFDLNTKHLIIDLVITNLLGEERKMKKIYSIESVDRFDNAEGITKLEYLPFQLTRAEDAG